MEYSQAAFMQANIMKEFDSTPTGAATSIEVPANNIHLHVLANNIKALVTTEAIGTATATCTQNP
jgi:plasmid maintenance system antidote protein VapI